MASSLLFAALATLAQLAPAQAVLVSRQTRLEATVDSIRTLRSARRAQANFESVRRMNLPREFGSANHHCDVRVGRWCIWNDESNDRKPPPEPKPIRAAREQLLAQLDSFGAAHPGDEWIASQQVRYLLEASRYLDAVRVSNRCTASGSRYLCAMLAGLAYHDSGAVAAADSAFDVALAAMPDSVRCRWTNISVLLEGNIADRYDHASCAARDTIASEFFGLTNPLYLRDHDWRNEFLGRVTQAEMERDSRTVSGSPDEDAYRETALRYGFDTWFVRDEPPMGSMMDVSIAGFRGSGSGYNFVPDPAVFDAPATLRDEDWDFRLRSAQTNYGPAYVRHLRGADRRQIAMFRRGDSALVVAIYDIGGDTLFSRGNLEAGLFTVPVDSMVVGAAHGAATQSAALRGVLTTRASWSPMVVSLELLNDSTRSAARSRFGMRPPPNVGRVGMSDLLLFAPRAPDSLPHELTDALGAALTGERITGTDKLGVFWETYGVRPSGESFAVTITIDRIREGLVRRAAEKLHLASPFSPVQVQWQEVPDREQGIASRAVALDLSMLGNGRYEISVGLTPLDGPAVVSRREFVVAR